MFLGRRKVDGKTLLAYEDAREVRIVPPIGPGKNHFSFLQSIHRRLRATWLFPAFHGDD